MKKSSTSPQEEVINKERDNLNTQNFLNQSLDNHERFNDEYITVVDDLMQASVFLKKFTNDETASNPLLDNSKVFKKYEEYKETKTLLKVRVSDADNLGNLYIPVQEGVLGIIKNEDVNGETYDSRKRSVFVGRPFLAVVKHVDRDSSTIYFSKAMARDAYQKLLRETLKVGMTVKARVRYVDEVNKRIYIDIEGCNLWGYVPINAWSHGFVYKPQETIVKNTVISVVIQKYLPAQGNKKEVYICSRKDAIPNPWSGIENRYKRNSIILVQCTDLQQTKFFARVADPNFDLEVYCEYPDNQNKSDKDKIIVKLGHYYKVRIYDVSEAARKLKARVIEEFKQTDSSTTI